MATDARLDQLAEVPIFSACSKKDLQRIASASDVIDAAAGRTLVEEGTNGREFFLILEGTAGIQRNGTRVAELGPGQYFGELALLDIGPRTATVVAGTDMKLLVLDRGAFLPLLDEVPRLAAKLLKSMAHRLRAADLENLGH